MIEGCKWLTDIFAPEGAPCKKEVVIGGFCKWHVDARKGELTTTLENIDAQIRYLKRQYAKKENELETLGE